MQMKEYNEQYIYLRKNGQIKKDGKTFKILFKDLFSNPLNNCFQHSLYVFFPQSLNNNHPNSYLSKIAFKMPFQL